jgi:O-antigen ligase
LFKLFSGTSELGLGMGTFVNRNHFAGYLLMVIPLTIGFLFSRGAQSFRKPTHWLHRLSVLDGKSLLIGFSAVVMILGLILSASRMGILSLLFSFSLIILLVRNPREGSRFSKRSVFILGLAILWGASIGLDAVISRFFLISDDLGMRRMIWENTQKIVKDFPVVGSGLGTFTQVFPMYRSFHIRGLVTHAENDFLQLVSEVGIMGFGLVLVLFLILIVRAVSNVRSLSLTEPQRYIGIGGLVGILALMCHSLVERNLQVPANAFLWTFLWALVLEAGTRRVTKIS